MFKKNYTDSWLYKTKQIWKYRLFFLLILFAFALIMIEFLGIINNNFIGFIITSIGTFAFLWLFIAIKCPSCKRRPMFYIMRKVDIGRLTQSLIGFKSCPFCGYEPGESSINIKDQPGL